MSQIENPCHQKSVWLSVWRTSPGVNICDVPVCGSCRVRVAGEPCSSWMGNVGDMSFPAFPGVLGTVIDPLALFFYFSFQSSCKTKTWVQMFFSEWKCSETSEMQHFPKPFPWLIIWWVVPCFRMAPGGPISSGNLVGFMVSVSGIFCLPWTSRETELAEWVKWASNTAAKGNSALKKGKPL